MSDIELFNTLTYDTIKASAISDIPDVYTEIVVLNSGDNEAGVYEFGFSLSFNFDSTTTAAFIQWRVDGGAWAIFKIEPSDVSDSIPVFYAYPKSYTSGVHTFELQMKKETSAHTLNIEVCDLFFKRVGV